MFLWLVRGLRGGRQSTGRWAAQTDVGRYAPEFDGVLMDLIIDYLETYVFHPRRYGAVFPRTSCPADGLGGDPRHHYASVVYLADTRMKTADKSLFRLSGLAGTWW